jgi:hypothetical protein
LDLMHPASAIIARVRVLATRVRWRRVLAVAFCGLFWLAVALALTGCATSASGSPLPSVQATPSRYSDRPTSFVLRLIDIAQINRDCRSRGPVLIGTGTIWACHYTSLGLSVVVMPLPGQLSPAAWMQLFAHEVAHALGWPGDHPAN